MHMKTLLFKIRHLKINNKTALRRIVSFLLCICISATMLCNLGGWMVSSAAESTQNVMNRIADEDTTDKYQDKLLSSDWAAATPAACGRIRAFLQMAHRSTLIWEPMDMPAA